MTAPATSADEQAFLRAIIESPDDDTPRLVYADYLAEHPAWEACPQCRGSGDPDPAKFVTYSVKQQRLVYEKPADARCPTCSGRGEVNPREARAELIRVQVESARLDADYPAHCEEQHNSSESPSHWCALCAWNEKAFPLRRREQELREPLSVFFRDSLPREWATGYRCLLREHAPGLTLIYQSGALEASVARGFIDSITCPAADWLQHGDAIAAAHPVRRVVLTTWPEGELTRLERQRKWKQPPRLGGHILDCWRAEWPRQAFELPPEPDDTAARPIVGSGVDSRPVFRPTPDDYAAVMRGERPAPPPPPPVTDDEWRRMIDDIISRVA